MTLLQDSALRAQLSSAQPRPEGECSEGHTRELKGPGTFFHIRVRSIQERAASYMYYCTMYPAKYGMCITFGSFREFYFLKEKKEGLSLI